MQVYIYIYIYRERDETEREREREREREKREYNMNTSLYKCYFVHAERTTSIYKYISTELNVNIYMYV